MSVKAHYVRIGLFAVVAAALGIAGIVVFGAAEIFERTVLAETYFDQSVQGLEVGSDVKHRGVKIGRIKEIGFVNEHYTLDWNNPDQRKAARYVRIVFSIKASGADTSSEQVNRMIANGLRIRADQQGITGTLLLQTDYRDGIKPGEDLPIYWKPDNMYIPSTPNTMAELTTSLQKVFNRVNDLDIEAGVTGFNETMKVIRTAIEEAKIGELSAQIKLLTQEARVSNNRIRELLEGEQVRQIVGDTAVIMRNVSIITEGLTNSVPQIARSANDVAKGLTLSVQHQSQSLDEVTEELRKSLANVNELLDTLKNYPSLMIFGKPPKPVE